MRSMLEDGAVGSPPLSHEADDERHVLEEASAGGEDSKDRLAAWDVDDWSGWLRPAKALGSWQASTGGALHCRNDVAEVVRKVRRPTFPLTSR